MRSIPPLLLADLQADATSIAFLWTIEMADGRVIRGTEHDRDIEIPSAGASPPDPYIGTYYAVANVTLGDITANTDMSVGNTEVTGAASLTGHDSSGMATVLDVSVDDIEAGLLDQAPVTILICNWREPAHGYIIVKAGILGAINRDSDGKYTTEVRGLTQLLMQTIIRTFSVTCNVVKFGDHRCRFDVAGATISGSVANNTGNTRLQFEADLSPGSPVTGFSYRGGLLTFTSGANAGFFREVKVDPNESSAAQIEFWEPFPEDVQAGDAFTLAPGCDRTLATCRDVYANLAHWRGYGVFIPGVNAITAGPTTTGQLS